MKTPKAVPYLLPPESVVSPSNWCTADGSEVGDSVDHWDPFLDLDLVRIVEVDIDTVRESCRLAADSAFALTANWYSNRTRISGEGTIIELGCLSGLIRTALALTVPGAEAGGRLTLKTQLILRHPGADPSRISPRRRGAILWNEEINVALEGGAARFPITAVDFTSIAYCPDDAAWLLEWNPDDLEAPVLGGLRLLVNSGHESITAMLRSGSADARAGMLRSFVTFDVARSLIQGALRSERFVDRPDGFEDGTIGRMIADLITSCWPGVTVPALRTRIEEDAARVSAELQARYGAIA
ncbi:MAG: hypothetical protein U0R18_19685 [Mycobacterium sp.]